MLVKEQIINDRRQPALVHCRNPLFSAPTSNYKWYSRVKHGSSSQKCHLQVSSELAIAEELSQMRSRGWLIMPLATLKQHWPREAQQISHSHCQRDSIGWSCRRLELLVSLRPSSLRWPAGSSAHRSEAEGPARALAASPRQPEGGRWRRTDSVGTWRLATRVHLDSCAG